MSAELIEFQPRPRTLEELLGGESGARAAIPGFARREAQIQMAEAVMARLNEGGSAAIEAPTGVGKTLAYLVPAALSGRRVVVSTHTKNLQDQIVDKDLPLLGHILARAGMRLVRATADDGPREPGEVRYALMKGRNNYLCLDRLERRTRQKTFAFLDGDAEGELRTWAVQTERGDRAELLGLPERSSLWDELDARSETCHGSRCAHFERCFVTRMRREAANANLIVVNHHLLLADMALKAQASLLGDGRSFGQVIPEAEALILDEAHALEEAASEYLGGQISSKKMERFARDVTAFIAGPPGLVVLDPARASSGNKASLTLRLSAAIAAVERVFAALPRREGRVPIGPAEQDEAPSEARRQLEDALAALEVLAAVLERLGNDDVFADALSRRAREIGHNLSFALSAKDPDFVYWAERTEKHATLGASPIDVGHLLRRFLFDEYGAVVMTSATLATGEGKLSYFLHAIGAPEDTGRIVLESPFDYPRQAALYLPEDAPEPDAPDVVLQLVRQGRGLIELVGGGALFLFTSYRSMQAVHAQLSRMLPYKTLIQGERPRRELLRSFIEQAPAVLFATASFWEGVDVPGDPLKLVLIDRLPFDPPNDPLAMARGARLEAAGKSAFAHYHLPRAILRLKQGFGRLVRGPSDRGVVAILDKRLQSRGYGPRFLKALPAATRFSDLPSLESWWRSHRAPPPKQQTIPDSSL